MSSREAITFTDLDTLAPPVEGVPQETAVIAAVRPALLRHGLVAASRAEGVSEMDLARTERQVAFRRSIMSTTLQSIDRRRTAHTGHIGELQAIYDEWPDSEERAAGVLEEARQQHAAEIESLEADLALEAAEVESAAAELPAAQARRAAVQANTAGATRISAVRDRLGRGAVLLAYAPGALLGVSIVQGGLEALERTGISSVNSDPSIFSGDDLPLAPGISDVSGERVTYRVVDGDTIVVSRAEGEDRSVAAVNPASPDFQLTGEEVGIDMQALRPVFAFIKDQDGRIIGVEVIGKSSDEAGGPDANLGQPDPRLVALAGLRADAGSQAAQELSEETGVAITGQIVEQAQEVIDQATVDEIRRQAAAANQSVPEFIARHKSGAAVQPILTDYLDGNRGAEFIIRAERTATEQWQGPDKWIRESRLFGLPGEVYATLVAAQLGFASMAMFADRFVGQIAHWRARYTVRQARKQHADD